MGTVRHSDGEFADLEPADQEPHDERDADDEPTCRFRCFRSSASVTLSPGEIGTIIATTSSSHAGAAAVAPIHVRRTRPTIPISSRRTTSRGSPEARSRIVCGDRPGSDIRDAGHSSPTGARSARRGTDP
jgi:hypothetical protein